MWKWNGHRLAACLTFLLLVIAPRHSDAAITQIIDATGDGGGNLLDGTRGVAVDASGNVYVTGLYSDNAFQISPSGTISEIIDSTGDGGSGLDGPFGIAVDASGNVYVTG